MFEHLGISVSTGNSYTYNPKNNTNNNTAVSNHINFNNCNASLDNFRAVGIVWLSQYAQTGYAAHFYFSMDLSQVYDSNQWVIDRFFKNIAKSRNLGT